LALIGPEDWQRLSLLIIDVRHTKVRTGWYEFTHEGGVFSEHRHMKKPNPKYVDELKRSVSQAPYFSLLSLEMVDIGIGFSLFSMELGQKHHHPFGFAHGGVFASIIDSAAFWAMHFDLEDPNSRMISVDLKLNFLAPAASGKLIARGRRIKSGRTLGYGEAEVTDEKGKILAHGTSTLMILHDKGLLGDRSFPGKFLE